MLNNSAWLMYFSDMIGFQLCHAIKGEVTSCLQKGRQVVMEAFKVFCLGTAQKSNATFPIISFIEYRSLLIESDGTLIPRLQTTWLCSYITKRNVE